jgi:hypothetical protein
MLANALRSVWLGGIQSARINEKVRLADWICRGQYYFDREVGPETATFILTPGTSLQNCYAYEVTRFAAASFETAMQIEQSNRTPQSLAWLVIQSYYSAYFAAHSLIRASGIACTQVESAACQKIGEIASALGVRNAAFKGGAYRCDYDLGRQTVVVRKPGGKGVHEQFWSVFAAYLRDSSGRILSAGSLPDSSAQHAASKLDELASVLNSQGCNGGNWLSMIRNDVNYRHTFGAWYPDWRARSYCDSVFHIQKQWQADPETTSLIETDDLKRFMRTCSFIVSLCRATVLELDKRSSSRNPPWKSAVSRLLLPNRTSVLAIARTDDPN